MQKYNLKPHLLVCKAAKSNPGKIACEHCGHLADNKSDLNVHIDAEHKDRVSQMEKWKKKAAAKGSNNSVRIRKYFKRAKPNTTPSGCPSGFVRKLFVYPLHKKDVTLLSVSAEKTHTARREITSILPKEGQDDESHCRDDLCQEPK